MSNRLTTYNPNSRPIAMAGFFSWLGRAVKAVAQSVFTALPFTNGNVWDVIEDFTNGDGSFGGQDLGGTGVNIWGDLSNIMNQRVSTQDLPLSQQDEAYLDNWVATKFTPFFKQKLQTIKNANVNGVSLEQFISIYNNTYKTISFFVWYRNYAITNENSGLSSNAITSRSRLIDIQMELLKEQLQLYIASNNIDVRPIKITAVSINTSQFNVLGFNVPGVISNPAYQITTTNNIIIFDGGDIDIEDNTNDTPIDIGASNTVIGSNNKLVPYSITAVVVMYAIYKSNQKSK
jgi:hypothetical protein